MSKSATDTQKEARAVVKYLKISPRKVRLVVNAIRYKPASMAMSILAYLNKKAARLVKEGLRSALANAKGKGLDETRLVISEIKADGGPVMKRFMSRSMGRADQILKRTTHLTLVLREGEKTWGPPPVAGGTKQAEKKEKPKKAKAGKAAVGKAKAKEMAQA